MKKFIYLFLLVQFYSAYCQNDFIRGFIITKNNDTIQGLIDHTNANLLAKYCYFKFDNDKDIIEYSPLDINGYGFEYGKLFQSRNVDFQGKNEYFFLELLVDGKIDLYFLRKGSLDFFFIEKENKIMRLSNDEIRSFRNGVLTSKESKEYIGVLNYFMRDANNFSDRIKTSELNYKSITNLIVDYHNNVCTDEEICIEYYKNSRLGTTSKWKIYIGIGIEGFRSKLILKPYINNSYQFNSTRHNYLNANYTEHAYGFSLPQIYIGANRNGMLSFQLGIKYNMTNYNNIKINNLEFPITIDLDLNKNKKITPYLSGGLSTPIYFISNWLPYYLKYQQIEYTYIGEEEQLESVTPNNTLGGKVFFGFGTKLKLKENTLKIQLNTSTSSIISTLNENIGPYYGAKLQLNEIGLFIGYTIRKF